MEITNRFSGTLRTVRAAWPRYLIGYGGSAIIIAGAIWISAVYGWYSFIILALAAIIVLFYFFGASLWAAHRLYDNEVIPETLFSLGELKSGDTFAHVGLGLKHWVWSLSRRLIGGQLIVIDVFNPQLTPNRSLARLRRQMLRQAGQIPADPRLSWRDGRIDLLPLADGSVSCVTVIESISELWQQGDQLCLLREIHRILTPGGHLLMAERVRTPGNFFIMGPGVLRLKPIEKWQRLLAEAGFQLIEQKNLHDLIVCLRVDKQSPEKTRQLALDLSYP